MLLRIHFPAFAIAAGLALAGIGSSQADVIYTFNTTATNVYPSGNPLQTDTVLGTLTTDGTLGVLSSANILSWNLNLIDQLDATKDFLLTPSNSEVVHVFGNALTATATGLSFDYTQAGAEFLIQGDNRGNSLHPISSGFNYFCFSATGGWCLAGESIVPDYYATDGVIVTARGVQPTDPGSNSVPEPGTLGLLALGLLGVGSQTRRRQVA